MKQIDKLKTRLELQERYIKKIELNHIDIKNTLLHLKNVYENTPSDKSFDLCAQTYKTIKLLISKLEEE